MKRSTAGRAAFLKNSTRTAVALIPCIVNLLGPWVHQIIVRGIHKTRTLQTVPSRSHQLC